MYRWYRVGFHSLVLTFLVSISGAAQSLTDLSASFENLVRTVTPAVVQIEVSGVAPVEPVGNVAARQVASGSGVIVDPGGYIVTNAHVIEGAQRIEVILSRPSNDGQFRSIIRPMGERLPARLVGLDRETDLAVLQIRRSGLPSLQLADSDELRQGELVIAIGSPLGLANSVTLGVVSSTARQLRPDAPMVYIQTDASVNPGNSGGPLLDASGNVVGINTFILSQSGGNEGISFAIPANIVAAVWPQIKATGRVQRGVIGVNAQTITPDLAGGLGLDRNWGVILGDVFPNSPARDAGLLPGDIILALNGKPMENGRQFDVNIYQLRIGDTATLSVRRNGSDSEVRVPVVERPGDPGRFADLVRPERNLIAILGVYAIDLTDDLIQRLGSPRRQSGVLIAALTADRGLAPTGLLPGDIIYELNGRMVAGTASLRSALERQARGEPLVFHIERAGRLRFVAMRMGS